MGLALPQRSEGVVSVTAHKYAPVYSILMALPEILPPHVAEPVQHSLMEPTAV